MRLKYTFQVMYQCEGNWKSLLFLVHAEDMCEAEALANYYIVEFSSPQLHFVGLGDLRRSGDVPSTLDSKNGLV